MHHQRFLILGDPSEASVFESRWTTSTQAP
jgi:hypothetical protein